MSFTIVASSFRIVRRRRPPLAEAAQTGLLAGIVLCLFALVGAYVAMDRRIVVDGVLSLAQSFALGLGLAAGVVAARQDAWNRGFAPWRALAFGALAGGIATAMLGAVLVLIGNINLRSVLVNASPQLVRTLAFGMPLAAAACCFAIVGLALGLVGGWLTLWRPPLRAALLGGLLSAVGIGLFRDLIVTILGNLPGGLRVAGTLFTPNGLRPLAAVAVLAAAAALWWRSSTRRGGEMGRWHRYAVLGFAALCIAVFPVVTGGFLAQTVMMIGLYVLMAMGLNVELGLAGLVDMGFVAFFAVGAYTIALLCTGTASHPPLSFWLGLPVAIIAAAVAGALFGLPILRVHGDYLAMATLGLGEIVRVLVLSDAMAPWLGGPQGIIDIAKPRLFGLVLNSPTTLYYLALVLAGAVGLISWRLQHSRIGRSWEAIREDEEVAQAMGVDPVAYKLMAYTIGAAFAGAAGAVFAVLVGSVFPSSFQLLVSLNVLAILVVGGLGSLPGVVVGTFVLIGLPEMFRELGDFRYLFYGVALVGIMRWRAEGLWPAAGLAGSAAGAR